MKQKFKVNKGKILVCLMVLLFLLCFIPPRNSNADYQLQVKGPYGDIQSYHPKVISFNKEWNGYKYWMSYTPYPKGDDLKENPCIAVSNDLINWENPNGLKNPIDEPINAKKATIYNSDSHLVYNQDLERLECYWRYTEYNMSSLYRRCTKDGIHWTKKELVLMEEDRDIEECISPAIIYENGIYKMWYVPKSGYINYMESKDGLIWKNKKKVKLKYKNKLSTWHLDVIKTDKGYEMLVVAFKEWKYRNDMNLYYSFSKDGINWEDAEKVLEPNLKSKNAWDNKGIYRSSFIYENDIYYVFYSGTDKNYNHGIGLIVGKNIKNLKANHIDYSEQNAIQKFNKMVEKER